MELRKITVPAAGEIKNISCGGRSVYVYIASAYPNPEDVPKIGFNSQNPILPIHETGTIPNVSGEIDRIRIKGTAESEGDEIQLILVDECLPFAPKGVKGADFSAAAGEMFSVTGTDTAEKLPFSKLVDENGRLPSSIYIQAREFDVNYAIKNTPTSGADSFLLPANGEKDEIRGIDFILNFEYINETSGGANNGTLVVLPKYRY